MAESIHEWIEVGKQHFVSKDYEQAEPFLRRVAQQQPAYADVQNMLGVIYHDEGRFNEAIDAFKAALKTNPNYTEAALNLAVLYNDLGEYKDAKKIYAKLQKGKAKSRTRQKIEPILKGKLSNMHAELGDLYSGLGIYGMAIAEYEHALELNPTYSDIQTKLAVAQRENGEFDASVKTLQKASRANSKYLNAKVQLGVTYYAMGNAAAAKRTWKAVTKADPKNPKAQMYLSLCEE